MCGPVAADAGPTTADKPTAMTATWTASKREMDLDVTPGIHHPLSGMGAALACL